MHNILDSTSFVLFVKNKAIDFNSYVFLICWLTSEIYEQISAIINLKQLLYFYYKEILSTATSSDQILKLTSESSDTLGSSNRKKLNC